MFFLVILLVVSISRKSSVGVCNDQEPCSPQMKTTLASSGDSGQLMLWPALKPGATAPEEGKQKKWLDKEVSSHLAEIRCEQTHSHV